ncbi:MAG: molybdate ABC transporter substrate-binding protein [Actinomycetota bacterium]|nr:molybdate ABC transporter substrate-binding protein [Actinomycetota bacterium]
MKRLTIVLCAAGLALAGCGSGDPAGAGSGAQQRVPVTVLAAASLTDVFGKLEPQFEAANPTADLRFSFGASSDLATQIVNGAPADVFASANQRQMKVVTDAGRAAGTPKPFTSNVLTIVVPPDNPKRIRSFADLAAPAVTELVCAPQVPCGAATKEIEKATNITLSPASEEPDVRSVLAKVQAGEADAGLVYITDARSAEGKVKQINFPEAKDAVNIYPIVAVEGAPQAQLAEAFIAFVLGPEGQRELTAAGFTPAA